MDIAEKIRCFFNEQIGEGLPFKTRADMARFLGLGLTSQTKLFKFLDGTDTQYRTVLEWFDKLGGKLTLPDESFTSKRPDIVFIEKLKARPSAGNGSLEVDDSCEGVYSFHKSFIQRKRGTPETMKLFEVSGDSMEPTLHDSDMVLINQSDKEIRTGQIYLLRIEDELLIKRVEKLPGGGMIVKSDNPLYSPITINMNSEEYDVHIFGRMVWLCREF